MLVPMLRAALETTWNPAYPNCNASMAACSWNFSGIEHHILLAEEALPSAIDVNLINHKREESEEGKNEREW